MEVEGHPRRCLLFSEDKANTYEYRFKQQVTLPGIILLLYHTRYYEYKVFFVPTEVRVQLFYEYYF